MDQDMKERLFAEKAPFVEQLLSPAIKAAFPWITSCEYEIISYGSEIVRIGFDGGEYLVGVGADSTLAMVYDVAKFLLFE